MAFEQRLVQKQTQKLILSPQIKQYIRLLPLPMLELQNTVEQELSENPALEEDLSLSTPDDKETSDEVEKNDELNFDETFDKLDRLDDDLKNTLYSEHTAQLESVEDLEKKHAYRESLIIRPSTLSDYVLWQLNFLELSEAEKSIAEYIIGNIDYNGYLVMSLEDIAQNLNTDIKTVGRMLSTVQTLDPPGVAARDLKECLLIQLNQHRKNRYVKIAKNIILQHFKLLERKDFSRLARALLAPLDHIRAACEIITSLEPKPGRYFAHDDATAIVPDASIYRSDEDDRDYNIEIHDERIPQLRINKKYRDMLRDKSLDQKTKDYLKSKINAAICFMKALDQRKSTLRQITEQIVQAQADFFERGFGFLKPLRLKDIAAQIGVHESTISRAVSGKYINTPQGTVPYKTFFSNKMETDDGSLESQTSIMEKVKSLIENEDPKKPLSDSKIVTVLRGRGIQIARRTIAKYRDMLKILPSHMRRQK